MNHQSTATYFLHEYMNMNPALNDVNPYKEREIWGSMSAMLVYTGWRLHSEEENINWLRIIIDWTKRQGDAFMKTGINN